MVCLKNLMLLLIMEPMRDPLYEAMVNMFNSVKVGANSKCRLFFSCCSCCENQKGPTDVLISLQATTPRRRWLLIYCANV